MNTYVVTYIDTDGVEQTTEVEADSPLMVIPELPEHKRILRVIQQD